MGSTGGAEAKVQTQSLLQNLTELAHTGLELTTQMLREQAQEAGYTDLAERVKIAKDGKRLLDEGGESVEGLVVAKHASHRAAEAEKQLMNCLCDAIIKLDDSVAKLKQAQARHGEEESSDFAQIAQKMNLQQARTEHEARGATCRRIASMLQGETSFATMTPEECDALAIVQAKAGYATALDKASDGLGSVKQKALTGMTSIYSEIQQRALTAGGSANSSEQAREALQAPTLLQSLQDGAHYNLQNAKQAATDRVECASAGKKLLDEGGEGIALVLVAKASLDAAEMDRDVAKRAQSALHLFEDSAIKLKAASTRPRVDGVSGDSDLGQLSEQHEQRVHVYREICTMLQDPIVSSGMNPAQWDALALVRVRDGFSALQCSTNKGFEVVKNMLVPGFSPEDGRDGRRTRN